jgi:NDP-sugar pyrophosphorylase family protein
MTAQSKYTGVILAGGRGSRMAPFSEKYPKPLLPVGNRPLMEYQIEIMRSLGITDIVILIGHKGYEIARVLGDGARLGVGIRYVEQTSVLGIAHAVGCLESEISRPFMLFLGDIFFVTKDLREMIGLFETQDGGGVLATRHEPNPDAIRKNYSLKIADDGFVTRVIEKPRHVQNDLKGVGLYFFDLTIFDAIRRTPRTAMRDEYEITDAIQVLIQDGYPVRASNCIEEDINLTSPADLLSCNLLQAKHQPDGALIGANVSIHSGARISNSVVGSNVNISWPISISDSVIFDNTRVESQKDFRRCIVTPSFHLDCNLSDVSARTRWV